MKDRNTMDRFLFAIFVIFASHLVTIAAAAETSVQKNIVWAEPKGVKLTLDIYTQKNAHKMLPVLIIFHGGGWIINNNSIMNDMANYMAEKWELVVVNVNYRLLTDNNNTTKLNEIVEDALGSVLWVKDHIQSYSGDANRIAVTGDSAGGHLAAMVALAARNLKSDGFANASLGFNPTYLPKGLTAEQVAQKDGAKVQAIILSYANLDVVRRAKNGLETSQNQFWKKQNATPRGVFGKGISIDNKLEYYQAVSPRHLVSNASQYLLPPHFVLVGSLDTSIPPEISSNYVELLKQQHQPAEFKIYEGKTHAFLDSGCSDYTGGCFQDLAPVALDDMILFLKKTLKK